MKIIYEDDALSGGGYGYLVFSEMKFPAGPLSFAIMRASDHQYATGTHGAWGGEKNFLPVEEKPGQDGLLQVSIGPGIVNGLDPRETYAVILKSADGKEERKILQIRNITYSPVESLDNTGSSREKEVPPEEVKPAPKIRLEKKEDLVKEKTEPVQEQKPLDMPAPQDRKKSGFWRWVILALLILGCLAWYFLDPRKYQEKDVIPPAAPEKSAGIEQPRPSASQAAPKASEAGPRIFFRGKEVSPPAAVALVRELPNKTKTEQDEIYRLLYFAARHGEASILMEYGACLDPSRPGWGTIGKDAPLAYEAYTRAKAQFPEEAEKARQQLLKWLKENATRNNQAKVWLEEIYK